MTARPLPDLEGLFEDPIRTGAAEVADHRDALHPSELEAITQASTARQCEFATGRFVARRLMHALGEPLAAIERNADRSPRWPFGLVGSITHSSGICAAAIGSAMACDAIGIDLEPDLPVKPGLERMICFGDELDWTRMAGDAMAGSRSRIVFSAKEAVYKAFHPRTRRVWRFAEVALTIDLTAERFTARLPADAGPDVVVGRLRVRDGWIIAAIAWRG